MSTSLSPSSDQLFDVVFGGPVGLAIMAADGAERARLMRVNPAFCELLGYTEDELLEQTFTEISHPDDAGSGAEAFAELLSGRVDSLDWSAASSPPPARCAGYASTCPRSAPPRRARPARSSLQVSDISEQKRLLTGQAAMIGAAIDAIVGIDAEGLITEFNPAAERVFGYVRSVVLGRPARRAAAPGAAAEVRTERLRA